MVLWAWDGASLELWALLRAGMKLLCQPATTQGLPSILPAQPTSSWGQGLSYSAFVQQLRVTGPSGVRRSAS